MSIFSCQLPRESFVHLRGKNIPAFLQGQLTCDTRKLSPEHAVSGAFCNVKGRVISDLVLIHAAPEHCILRLRRSVAATFATTLARYAQFSRISVELHQPADALQGIYADTTAAATTLAEAGSPAEVGQVSRANDTLYYRSAPLQLEVIELGEPRESLLTAIEHRDGSEDNWRGEVMSGGHYCIDEDDLEAFTPQSLNYDLSGRVAFDKGCYTGQEVIARLHYKGKAKRRVQMYLCQNPALTAQRDDTIDDGSGKAIGRVLRLEKDSQGRSIVAAEILVEQIGVNGHRLHHSELSPLSARQ